MSTFDHRGKKTFARRRKATFSWCKHARWVDSWALIHPKLTKKYSSRPGGISVSLCALCVLCVVVSFSAIGGPRWRYITANISLFYASAWTLCKFIALVECLTVQFQAAQLMGWVFSWLRRSSSGPVQYQYRLILNHCMSNVFSGHGHGLIILATYHKGKWTTYPNPLCARATFRPWGGSHSETIILW